MPYIPRPPYAVSRAAEITTTGMTTLRIPADIPLRILVAAPLLDASAICATGRDDVKYSEARPMRTPDTTPTVTALPAFIFPNTPKERGIEAATSATEAPIDP